LTNPKKSDILTSIIKKDYQGRPTTFVLTRSTYRRPRTYVGKDWTVTWYADRSAHFIGNECVEELTRLCTEEIERTRNND
jgi:hypothetical protein